MAGNMTQEDLLNHVDYAKDQLEADDPKSLRNQVSSTDGSITIISAFGCQLVLNYSFTTTGLNVTLVLNTPVGSATLGSATLNPSNPSITVGGSIDSFKAEVTVSLDFSSMNLTAQGTVCAPFLGCKSGQITIHV